ncbi:MAG TPA: 2-oxo acid dehydrogenase subunit E2 [Vicinamibacterales bacterium]|nr:2-oxo acid dehydrogenase subunit E2 [Vicinamibacterales bacterium]
MTEFRLPELGENIAAGDVLRVLVSPGDVIKRDQSVLELETDKATIEVPSSIAGRVTAVSVKVGDKVKVGQVILVVEEGAAEAAPAAAPAGPPAPGPIAASAAAPAAERREPEAREEEEASGGAVTAPAASSRRGEVVDISRAARPAVEPPLAVVDRRPPAPAAPSVRRLARELGVDIHDVSGSGLGGRISMDDVKAHAKRLITEGGAGPIRQEPLPDFSRWGRVERQPMSNVRRKTAEHLSYAWATVPHVTQHDRADITSLEELRKRMANKAEAAGGSLTLTVIALKVVASALKMFPQFNAAVDMARNEIVYKKYEHIGVAVDTDRGLLVPVIRDVDSKNIIQLSVELAQLAEKARSRKLSREEMEGGSFTITNLGGIGGTAFSPIVHTPEVAILGISRGSIQPVWQRRRPAPGADARGVGERGWSPASLEEDGQFVPRLLLPLSLSYDHRVIDGADAIRFLRWIAEALEQPFLLSLEG